jgi:hypothetical protein
MAADADGGGQLVDLPAVGATLVLQLAPP